MKEPCNGLYANGALAKLRELHNAFAKSGNQCQFGSEARKEWERALCQAGPALLSAAEENERLLTLVRMIARNHDAGWDRQSNGRSGERRRNSRSDVARTARSSRPCSTP